MAALTCTAATTAASRFSDEVSVRTATRPAVSAAISSAEKCAFVCSSVLTSAVGAAWPRAPVIRGAAATATVTTTISRRGTGMTDCYALERSPAYALSADATRQGLGLGLGQAVSEFSWSAVHSADPPDRDRVPN